MEVTHEYASKGVAGTGLGLGIAGTALALLGNGGLGNLFCGNGWGCNGAAQQAQANTVAFNNALAERDAEIARLRSEKYSDNKVQELYNYITAGNKELTAELCNTRSRLAVLEHQMRRFDTLTVTRIPNSVLCPGVPAVEVVHPTTTTAATTTAAAA